MLTAKQLRRKRRDRAWFQWEKRRAIYLAKVQGILRKYFARERDRVLAVLNRVNLQAVGIDAEPLSSSQLFELQYQIQKELQAEDEETEAALLMLLLLIAAGFTNLTVFDLEYSLDDLEHTTDIKTPTPIPAQTQSWIQSFLDTALTLIAATTLKKLLNILSQSQQKQKTLPETIDTINEAYEKFIRNRAPGIAGDMVGKIASMAQQIAILQLPVNPADIRQTWVSMRDDRVRDSHQELDGQTRKMGDDFKPGLKFPRDPNAPLSESLNCRCWLMVEQAKKAETQAA